MEQNFLIRTIGLAFAMQLLSVSVLSQSIAYPQQIWLQESSFNPAASGARSNIDAYGGYSKVNYAGDIYDYGFQSYVGLANVKLAKLNSGFGISFNRKDYSEKANYYESNDESATSFDNFRLNYNYQFQLKKQGILSLGATFLYQNFNWQNYSRSFCGNDPFPLNGEIKQTGVGFGAIFSKPKWHIGFSFSPAFLLDEESSPHINFSKEYSFSGAYSFDAGKNTKLTPYLYFLYLNDYNYFYPRASLGIRLEHEWFLAGISLSGGDFGYLNGTLGITVFKNYALIYTLGVVLDSYAQELPASHSFGLRYNFVN